MLSQNQTKIRTSRGLGRLPSWRRCCSSACFKEVAASWAVPSSRLHYEASYLAVWSQTGRVRPSQTKQRGILRQPSSDVEKNMVKTPRSSRDMPPAPSAREYTLEEVVSPTFLPASAIFSASDMAHMCHSDRPTADPWDPWAHNDVFGGGRQEFAGECAFERRSFTLHRLLHIFLPDHAEHFPPCCV